MMWIWAALLGGAASLAASRWTPARHWAEHLFGAAAGLALMAIWTAPSPSPPLWPSMGLGFGIVLLSCVDARSNRLPNVLTLPLAAAGLAVFATIAPQRAPDHLIGAALGYAILALVSEFYWRWRKIDALGLGDAKMAAAGGAWLGWEGLAAMIIWAASAALIWTLMASLWRGEINWRAQLPFGPFLGLGLWITWCLGPLNI